MCLTTLGIGLSTELGFAASAFGGPGLGGDPLGLGAHRRLADLLTQTPIGTLQQKIMQEIDGGTSTSQLIAAGALANARAFGGEDYDGYHAFMALMPAFQISQSMVGRAAALPVMKVLYRNTARMQTLGTDTNPCLTAHPGEAPALKNDSHAIVANVRKRDKGAAEAAFDRAVREDAESSFEQLIPVVCQEVDVHRVVLAWRGWDLLQLTGVAHARTLMRQSIRQCVDREAKSQDSPIRKELPSVLDDSGVLEAPLGDRAVDAAWIDELARELSDASRKQGATRVARALIEGVEPKAIGQALSLAATYLMLRQNGRTTAAAGKPVGSVHGAGVGVHGSDTAAAWRGMARFGSERQRKLALVAGAYHVAGQGQRVAAQPFGYGKLEIETRASSELLGMLAESVRKQDQAGAAAVASRYAQLGHSLAPVLSMLLDFSVAADGALHAEKYYRTQVEALEGDNASFRPLHLAALARVCASQSAFEASGRGQALELIG
ncbi:MAG: hypothetical protein ACI9F9_000692 [Candidatus Paceibacteria bacterium]|jgi:hypothetical protein